jgi:hypothetical protein
MAAGTPRSQVASHTAQLEFRDRHCGGLLRLTGEGGALSECKQSGASNST